MVRRAGARSIALVREGVAWRVRGVRGGRQGPAMLDRVLLAAVRAVRAVARLGLGGSGDRQRSRGNRERGGEFLECLHGLSPSSPWGRDASLNAEMITKA